MHVVVCVKQVPVASEVRFDPVHKTAVREGVPLTINAFDRRALTEALRLAGETGGQVIAVTMGPPQAREALVECLALGCRRAVHVCDPALAGSDSLVTARVLAAALRRLSFDLVFCGKWSVDAETGQVGPMLAELLRLPQVTGVTRVAGSELRVSGCEFLVSGSEAVGSEPETRNQKPETRNPVLWTVDRETDEGLERVEVRLPALFTAAERLVRPASPTDEALAAAAERAGEIETLTAADLGFRPDEVGLAGSPTRVSEIRTLEVARERRLLEGEPAALAAQLVAELERRGLLRGEALREARPFPPGWRPKLGGPPVWVVAEVARGQVRHATLELLGKGAELAHRLDGELAAVLIGGTDVERHVPTLGRHGAARVYLAAQDDLAGHDTERCTTLIAHLVESVGAEDRLPPRMVLFSATSQGRDLAPRVAARLGLGLTADCLDLELDADGSLVQLKPAFGGLVVAPILTRTRPELATVRPGMLPRPRPLDEPNVQTTRVLFTPVDSDAFQSPRVVETIPQAGEAGLALDDAPAVVCVGTGLGGPERLPQVEALARALGGAVGGTRKVVDLGWLPRQQQVGLTGRAIAPRLYLGLGVRGAFNHSVGILRAGTIVAINTDPTAEIFQACDLGLVADCRAAVPALIEALRRVGGDREMGRWGDGE